jgi:hypothetical protein
LTSIIWDNLRFLKGSSNLSPVDQITDIRYLELDLATGSLSERDAASPVYIERCKCQNIIAGAHYVV